MNLKVWWEYGKVQVNRNELHMDISDEWIKKTESVYMYEYCSALREKKGPQFEWTLMALC